jgi:hypothetical protein
MMPQDVRHLLAGYATNSLSEEERKALFAAALEDQSLFDEMMLEQPLAELLADPNARDELSQTLIKESQLTETEPVSAAAASPFLIRSASQSETSRSRSWESSVSPAPAQKKRPWVNRLPFALAAASVALAIFGISAYQFVGNKQPSVAVNQKTAEPAVESQGENRSPEVLTEERRGEPENVASKSAKPKLEALKQSNVPAGSAVVNRTEMPQTEADAPQNELKKRAAENAVIEIDDLSRRQSRRQRAVTAQDGSPTSPTVAAAPNTPSPNTPSPNTPSPTTSSPVAASPAESSRTMSAETNTAAAPVAEGFATPQELPAQRGSPASARTRAPAVSKLEDSAKPLAISQPNQVVFFHLEGQRQLYTEATLPPGSSVEVRVASTEKFVLQTSSSSKLKIKKASETTYLVELPKEQQSFTMRVVEQSTVGTKSKAAVTELRVVVK